MVLLHGFLKTWGELLRRLLALAKRRQWRGYDAVKLAAAYGSPALLDAGLPGGVANTANKIEIRYNGPGLWFWMPQARPIHVVLITQFSEGS